MPKYTVNDPIKAVYLDGVKQEWVFGVDTDNRTAKRYVLNEQGLPFLGYRDESGAWQPSPRWKVPNDARCHEVAWEEVRGQTITIERMTRHGEIAWRLRRARSAVRVMCGSVQYGVHLALLPIRRRLRGWPHA